MPSAAPPGDPAPVDGSLTSAAIGELSTRSFSFYVHVPYCRIRCGYCDFNTYTLDQLTPDAQPEAWLSAVHSEIELAAQVLNGRAPAVETVFFGGGTPTLLEIGQLTGVLKHIDQCFGLTPGAEVSTEANPETIGPAELESMIEGGINRLSLGMQSAVPHVLSTLDRVHTPGRVLKLVESARSAGFEQISLDLIYGTPGESSGDWQTSLDAAVSTRPEHISAYALVIEPGTAMARKAARGEIHPVNEDMQADCYLMAEKTLTDAGYQNYEISNWATDADHRARHNMAYWLGSNWWGLGPGAHSHVGGVRWWNLRHPSRYAAALAAGGSPAQAREVLDDQTRRMERVMLELRLSDGLPVSVLTASEYARLPLLAEQGLVVYDRGRVRLSLDGRLLADAVIRDLLD